MRRANARGTISADMFLLGEATFPSRGAFVFPLNTR
jgi:hypothetical protein